MKHFYLLLLLVAIVRSFAQNAGNEWINYNQEYFVFKVYEDGIYRITHQDLLQANIPVNALDPRHIQIFARGKEVPLYVEGEGDGVFNTSDFIEFYGTKNDGWIDSVFYQSRTNQPNPYYSLISDTIYYYLTWNNSISNRRIAQENAIDFGNYFPASFIWKEEVIAYNSTYYDGETEVSRATDPDYVESEGWMDRPISKGGSANYTLSFVNRYQAGPFVNLEIQYSGESDWGALSNGDHHVRISVGGQTKDDVFEGYDLRKMSFSFSPSNVIGGNNTLTYQSIDDLGSGADRTAVSFIKYSYPHTLVLRNSFDYSFQIDDHSSQSKQYLEFLNFNGGNAPVFYDLTNHKRIRVIRTLNSYRALVPNSGGKKSCYIANASEIKQVSIESIGNNNFFVDYAGQNVDSAYIMLYHSSLLNEVSRYANFRLNKGYYPLLVDVQQLYHQFGYGVSKNPLSIRNFIDFAFANFNTPPQYLFLIGKSVNHKEARKEALKFNQNLVPSFGNPSVDNLLASGLQGTNLESPIPIGRLSAKNLADLGAYLNKVIEYESATTSDWMKKALHFAGGLSLLETNQFENFFKNYENEFNSPPMGGTAQLFKKSTSIPIQTTLSDSIRTLINSGVSLMTFFGHASAAGGFDISIDSPDKLNNRGKYPVILANSCFSGNYHQADVLSVAEQYVLENNKGSIAFIASGNLGFASTLNTYSSALYKNLASENYGKSLAENMIETVKDIQVSNTRGSLRLVCLEMSLQGDPAIKLNPHALPDYRVREQDVSVSPSQITSDLDSFNVHIQLYNIGLANNDTVLVQVNHQFPESTKDTVYFQQIPNLFYKRSLDLTLPIDLVNGIGQNEFSIIIDPNNTIPELQELNNRVDFEVMVRSGDIIPVYPYNYSIVGQQVVKLSASTAFALEESKEYLFELDTSSQFNSLLKESNSLISSGGIIEWEPNLLKNMPDSQVYFWRITKAPQPGESPQWRQSSFQYIPNEQGWAQDHFDQLKENDFLFMQPNSSARQFSYVDNVKELYVYTVGSPSIAQTYDIRYSIDSDVRERNACGATPAFLIAVLDSLNLESWETKYFNLNPNNDFGQANKDDYCGTNRTRPEKFFMFRTNNPQQLDTMKNFLKNVVPDGAYIVVYTWFGVDYSAINTQDSTILKTFEELGSNMINSIPDDYPFIFSVQKGKPSTVMEVAGTSVDDQIELRRVLSISADFGDITSLNVPFSPDWNKLSYRIKSLDSPLSDSVSLELRGELDGGVYNSITRFSRFNLDTTISTLVNNNGFKTLQLKLRGFDENNQTPPQLERWQVSGEEIPDFALTPNIHYSINSDSLQEGQVLALEIGVKNISMTDGDSLKINYQVLTASGQILDLVYPRQKPLLKDSLLISKIEVPTNGLLGRNKLLIEVNPNNDQAEYHGFNNIGQIDFLVYGDQLNPLIDVTFDGRHILNREIVSAQPEIIIQLEDENSYLALDDTSVFSIFLRHPDGNEELMNFGTSGTIIDFIPATLPDNKATARLRPLLHKDGVYGLRIQAFDKSGNTSGSTDYFVEFEVVNRSTITHLVNYPNPFSTSTRFVFTLTGSQVPDQMQIQILTVTGKVVREIDQFELGDIHIGNNITEFAWDGKDEYGDQLANGVYLYRVRAKINGNNIEHRDSEADNFFTKEFGKMYLLR